VLEGDGIGPEITAATLEVLNAANSALSLQLAFEHADIGLASLRAKGTTLTDAVVDAAKSADGVILASTRCTRGRRCSRRARSAA
jgi:3-isopropylmalate dehydrogenase